MLKTAKSANLDILDCNSANKSAKDLGSFPCQSAHRKGTSLVCGINVHFLNHFAAARRKYLRPKGINLLPAICYGNKDRIPWKYGKGLSSQVVKLHVGSYSTCQRYRFPMGTLVWKVSQILSASYKTTKRLKMYTMTYPYDKKDVVLVLLIECNYSYFMVQEQGRVSIKTKSLTFFPLCV